MSDSDKNNVNRLVKGRMIKETYKGLLRVSPDTTQTDDGIGSSMSGVSDSAGNMTNVKISQSWLSSKNTALHGKTLITDEYNLDYEMNVVLDENGKPWSINNLPNENP